jgi:mRNA-degrading endonuclease RelE of RelBE toxin-antitoxin system
MNIYARTNFVFDMAYIVELTEDARKTLDKLDNSQKVRIVKKLKELEINPELGKPIGKSETLNAIIWELRMFSPNLRIYYIIKRGTIVVEEIEYEGSVNVYKIGDKGSQRRDIDGIS